MFKRLAEFMYAITELSELASFERAISTSLLTFAPETRLFEVITQMNQHQPKTGYVLVLENRKVLGWFTAADLLPLVANGIDLQISIAQVMNTSVITRLYSELVSIGTVISLLRTQRLPFLVIVDEKGLVEGIITADSIFQSLDIEEINYINQAKLFHQLADNINAVLFVRDVKLDKVIYASSAYERIWGRNRISLYENSQELIEAIHPEDVKRISRAIANQTDGKPYYEEYRIIRPNGDIRWVSVRGFPIKNQSGETCRFIGIAEDISKRKEVEDELAQVQAILQKALSRNKELFNNLLESFSQQLWFAGTNGRFEFANRHMLEYLKSTKAELATKEWKQFIHPDDLALVSQGWKYSVATGNIYEVEARMLGGDGTYRWHRIRAVPLQELQGKIFSWFGTNTDIHDRKLTEEAFNKTEESFRLLIEGVKDYAIFMLNPFGYITTWNSGAQNITGYKAEEIVGQHFRCLVSLENELEITPEKVLEIAATQGCYECDCLQVRKDGCEYWANVVITALYEPNGKLRGFAKITRDITERKQAEEELIKFRKVIESTGEAIGITDANGDVTYINSSFKQTFLYDIETLNACKQLATVYYSQQQAEIITEALKEGRSWFGEATTRTRYNGQIPMQVRTDLIFNLKGKLIGYFSICTDISDKKQLEENIHLRDSAISTSTNGIAIVDVRLPNKPIVYVNKAFERITGYRSIDVIGQNCRLLQSYDGSQEQLDQLAEAMQKAKKCTVLVRNYNKNGNLFWTELHIAPVFSRMGKLTHYIEVQNDISYAKTTEIALQLSKARLEYVLGSSLGAIYTYKIIRDYPTTYVSPNVYLLLGYEDRDFLIDPFLRVKNIHNDDINQYLDSIPKIIEQEQYVQEYRFRHKDGKYRWLLDQCRIRYDDEGHPIEVVGFLTDISLRKQLEHDLQVALEKEKQLNEFKSRFISITSHEFRTPLSTIFSSSELLEHYRHKWTEEKQLTHIHRIQSSVKHMIRLLDDVLIIGKAEAGKFEFNPKEVNLIECCYQFVEEAQINARDTHKIEFIAPPKPMTVWMDERLLGHIFSNLLSNAIKYSPADSTIIFTIKVLIQRVVFIIEDQGIGIPPKDLPHLFDSFHRASNVTNIQGTGLGLSIVKKCVEIHQGKITISSQLGIGTTFTVTLPVVEGNRE